MPNRYRGICNNKGMVLFFVLMLVFMETILAGIILGTIRSNDRNTEYRINRIKAYYAVNAAMVYTRAKLSITGVNSWGTGNYAICPSAALCTGYAAANQLIDYNIPCVVTIVVGAAGTGPAGSRTITLSADYTSLL